MENKHKIYSQIRNREIRTRIEIGNEYSDKEMG
jgi:hypothetical protein